MAFPVGSYIWIPDGEEVCIPAKVASTFSPGSAGKVTRIGDEEKTVKLTASDTKEVKPMNEQSLDSVDDMVSFKELNEYSILHNLRVRYQDDKIYTNIGRILTSVNPFKLLPIYSPEVMDEYMEKGARNMPPHVFGVADDAFNAMIENKKSQSCIVSGESGAGKTEATKVFLQYVSEKSKRQLGQDFSEGNAPDMQQKIMQSNPLLEAFGNAKTVRNDNSSRFGKWIEIQFHRRTGAIVGGSLKSYLLEKSRIVNQANLERNYHIFYQLCAAAEVEPELADFDLQNATQYMYLNQSAEPVVTVEGIDDYDDWKATLNAMRRIGISDDEIKDITKVLTMVLTTGNILFEGSEVASVKKGSVAEGVVKRVADLMGVEYSQLERALVKIDRSNRADPDLVGNHDLRQALDARDALAKHVYAALFNWLIEKVNLSLGRAPDSENISTIGILDIFGFEFFKNNSFEQLCINYCNERLQGHFNDHIFKLEQDEYAKEGVDVTKIEYVDNGNVILAIDSKAGLLQLIAEQLKQRNGTDQKLLEKIKKIADESAKKSDSPVISYPSNKEVKLQQDLEDTFKVAHYAGVVGYRIEQFLEKNRDSVPKLLSKLGKTAKNAFIKNLFDKSEGDKKKPLGLRFSSQLKDLMKDLNSTQPHYVRCVKPNAEKVKDSFTAPMVMDQLRYAGLLEVCRIRQMGYPVRKTHSEFFDKYKFLSPGGKHKTHTDLIAALVEMNKLTDGQYQVGKSQVFLKTDTADKLEEERASSLALFVVKIQRVMRGHLVRRVSKRFSAIRQQLRDAIAKREKEGLQKALLVFGQLPYGGKHLQEYREGKELMNKIEDEERVYQQIKDAVESRELNNLQVAITAAEKVGLGSSSPVTEARYLVELIQKENICKDSLLAAIKAKNEQAMKLAVTQAQTLKLTGSKEFKEAKLLLDNINKERVTRGELENAIKEKDLKRIKMFMNALADMGKADDPLVKQGEEIVKEKAEEAKEVKARRENALFSLKKAIKNKNLEALDELEMEVINLGIEDALVEEAKNLKDQLRREKAACEHLGAESKAIKSKSQSRAGLTADDLESFNTVLEKAKEVLEPNDFELLQAMDVYENAQEQLKVQESLVSILAEVQEKRKALVDIKDNAERDAVFDELIETLRQAQEKNDKLGINVSEAQEVRDKLNQLQLEKDERGEKERIAKREANLAALAEAGADVVEGEEEKRNIFAAKTSGLLSDKMRQILSSATDNNKYDLTKFYRIRSDDDFVQNVPDAQKTAIALGKLEWSPKQIPKSILSLDDALSKESTKINKAILQYSGDVAANFLPGSGQYVLAKPIADESLRDEVYVQLMKQLTQNPSEESVGRLWGLLCLCTKSFPPSTAFAPYLVNFFANKQSEAGLIGNQSKLCLVQLDATIELGATKHIPNGEELKVYRKRPPILATIKTLNDKEVFIPVTPEMRVGTVLGLVKLKVAQEFPDVEYDSFGIYVQPEQEDEESDSFRERLRRFYQYYNANKMAHIDMFIDHYKGNVEELFQRLTIKYGPEPPVNAQAKPKGILALPITAAQKAVKFFGFANQREQPPTPETEWPLPWWTHLGDVVLRMAKQKKKPSFLYKRKLITKQEDVDELLYLQAVDDVSKGFLVIKDETILAEMAALALQYEVGAENLKEANSLPALEELGLGNFIPHEVWESRKGEIAELVIDCVADGKIPNSNDQIKLNFIGACRRMATYGLNYFYATHAASGKNYCIAVDIDGIHVLSDDRAEIKRSFGYESIKKFGATGEYFWMNINEDNGDSEETGGRFRFLAANNGINVLLYSLQSWEMYDCVYEATHIGSEEEEGELSDDEEE